MFQSKKAFTLVELIVVITILAILWTIAFISLQWYSKNARDSARISDASNITSSLEIFVTKTWFYPEPENGFDVSYSGSMVWHQWILSDNVVKNLGSLSEVPLDPLTGTNYTYSRLNTKKEFEIGLMLEVGSLAQKSIIWQATAASKVWEAYIKWTYNGIVAKVTVWPILYMLAVPSIINWGIGAADYEDIVWDLVFNGWSNAPSSYDGTDYGTSSWSSDSIEFTPTSWVVIYSGSTTVTSWDIIAIVEWVQNTYNNSWLENDWDISTYLAWDASTETDWSQYVWEIFVHENIDNNYIITAPVTNSAWEGGGGGGWWVNLYDLMLTHIADNSWQIPSWFNNNLVEFWWKLYFIAQEMWGGMWGPPMWSIFDIISNTYAAESYYSIYSIDDSGTVTELTTDEMSVSALSQKMIEYNNKLYFVTMDGVLHFSDTGGSITDVTGLTDPQEFTIYNNKLYFRGTTAAAGTEILSLDSGWGLDTVDIYAWTSGSYPDNLTVYNGELYFQANISGTSNIHYINTWNVLATIAIASPNNLTVYNNKLYFTDNNFDELHSVDSSHTLSQDIVDWNQIGDLVVYNNLLYYIANQGTWGQIHYLNTSGTPTTFSPDIYLADKFIVYNNLLYYDLDDATDNLYYIDGSNSNNTISSVDASALSDRAVYNNKLYFMSSNGCTTWLFSIDSSNTVVHDQNIGTEDSCS